MQEDLKREFVQKFLCQDGLCLGHGEVARTLADGTTAVTNDNGILFAAYGYFMFAKELDGADAHRFYTAVKSLEREPGLYNRRPDAPNRREAHDNYDAISACSALFDLSFARDICTYGEQHGWSFTNTTPGGWSIEQLRQGGSIAFYKLCAGRVPYPLEFFWLLGGILHSLLFGWSSQWNLAWLKLRAVPLALDRYSTPGPLWGWVRGAWTITAALAWAIAAIRGLFPRSFKEYFGEQHVITLQSHVEYM
jgi:hypothetical protein